MVRVLQILVLLPLIYTAIFGGLFYKNLVTGVPIIVVNLDDGTAGLNLVRDLSDTPEVDVILIDGDAAGITAKMLDAGASGAVVIPKDYSEKISRGESTSVELIIDNTNTILGGTVTRAVQTVIATASAEILAADRIAAGWNTYQAQSARLTLSTRIFFNPTSGYTDFFLTVLILHSVQIALVFAIAPAVVEAKLSGLKINLAAQLFAYASVGIAVTALCLAAGIKFFGMTCRGSFAEIMAIVAAFSFCMTAFALAVGAWNKVPYHTITYTLAYVMPSILFTGAIWPRYSMDPISVFLSYAMPIGYAAEDLRNLFLKGAAFGWEFHAVVLILAGAVFFTAGVIGLKITGGAGNVADNAAGTAAAD